jgi:2-dehydro-3-deoxygluconokinase
VTGKRVVCFGELLLRLTPPGHELPLHSPQMRVTPAGAEANVAVALASFGQAAKLLTVLPDNALGRAALNEVRRYGVDVGNVVFGEGRMGLFFLTPGAVTRPSDVLYDRAESAFAKAPSSCFNVEALSGAAWFHVSGVTPALGRSSANATIAAVRAARERNILVSFDGNYRSKLWEGWADQAPGILREIFAQADIVFGDERDIALVLGRAFDDRAKAVAAAFAGFPHLKRIACTTRAAHSVERQDYGAAMYTRADIHLVPAVQLSGIVDRLGAGDAFAAGVIHGLLSGMGDGEALKFGHAAAVLKHSLSGDFFTLGGDAVRAAMGGQSVDVKR